MTYEEFKKELYVCLCGYAGGQEVKLVERGSSYADAQGLRNIRFLNVTPKDNEEIVIHEDVIYVQWGKGNAMRMLYWSVRPLYERFKKEGWQSILPTLAAKLQNPERKETDRRTVEESYMQVGSHLMIRPMNYRRLSNEWEDAVYWRLGDITLVLYAFLFDTGQDLMTMKVSRSAVEKWKLSDNIVLTNALLNTYAKMPPRLYHAEDMFGYRLTTTQRVNGAIALFYPGVKERMAELLEGDYYVGFTSIHEAVIHPVQHKVLGRLKEAISQTNAVFDQRELLTDRIYRYLSTRQELVEV